MLIRVGHTINLSTRTAEELVPILVRPTKRRHINALLHRSTLPDLIGPLLQSWELGQIDLQRGRCTADPRVIRNVGDRVLGSSQVRAVLQTGIKDGV